MANNRHGIDDVALPANIVLAMVRRLMEFPYPQICRHLVASDLLSALSEHGYPISNDLAEAVVCAHDDDAIQLLDTELDSLNTGPPSNTAGR